MKLIYLNNKFIRTINNQPGMLIIQLKHAKFGLKEKPHP